MAVGMQDVLPPAVPVGGGILTRRRRLLMGRGEDMFVFPLGVRRAAWCLASGGALVVAAQRQQRGPADHRDAEAGEPQAPHRAVHRRHPAEWR